MSLDQLAKAIADKQNPTVAGLDPKLGFIPDFIRQDSFARHGKTLTGAADAILTYNKGLIDALCDVVPAVKPQCAYYELYGWPGVRTLHETIAYAKEKGLYVITDGKRNDIGTTMEAYASAHLGQTDVDGVFFRSFAGDALTVNGYLGSDGIQPLLNLCQAADAGIFVLVKTSNPSSGELQDLKFKDDRTLYAVMGELCETWGKSLPGKYGYSGVGAVIGATYPEQLGEMRAALPNTFFLVPGYGAQGAGAQDVLPAFDRYGLGAVVNSSRAILRAWQKENSEPEDYAGAARREALRMRTEFRELLGEIRLPV